MLVAEFQLNKILIQLMKSLKFFPSVLWDQMGRNLRDFHFRSLLAILNFNYFFKTEYNKTKITSLNQPHNF